MWSQDSSPSQIPTPKIEVNAIEETFTDDEESKLLNHFRLADHFLQSQSPSPTAQILQCIRQGLLSLKSQNWKLASLKQWNQRLREFLQSLREQNEEAFREVTKKVLLEMIYFWPEQNWTWMEILHPFLQLISSEESEDSPMAKMVLLEYQKIYFFLPNHQRVSLFKRVAKELPFLDKYKKPHSFFNAYDL